MSIELENMKEAYYKHIAQSLGIPPDEFDKKPDRGPSPLLKTIEQLYYLDRYCGIRKLKP